ncbi:hypothetical protein CEXT_433711 [Caerostris extrusa]|uniref:Uncharacterized protein n=1 Tax=Caerostris extrusa TaxID=172846 RepID=A0AAV4TKG5_CAEEX|nr:hypothetical protein CEXT_433711 [Caerostris extrusa]
MIQTFDCNYRKLGKEETRVGDADDQLPDRERHPFHGHPRAGPVAGQGSHAAGQEVRGRGEGGGAVLAPEWTQRNSGKTVGISNVLI